MVTWSIYRILFPNGKSYIGLTKDLHQRKLEHKYRAFTLKKVSPVCTAIRKYGGDALVWETLVENITTLEEANKAEHFTIIKYDSFFKYGKGYNSTSGGDGTPSMVVSEEQKTKTSIASKLRWKDPEYRERHRKGMLTRKPSIYRNKANMGKHLRNPETHPWKGKHHTPETIELKRKIATGGLKVLNQETGIIYPSLAEAARKNPHIHRDTIRNICNKKYKNPSTKDKFIFIKD